MKARIEPTTDRILVIEAKTIELVALYRALTSTGRRTTEDRHVMADFARSLLTDPDVAARVSKGERA